MAKARALDKRRKAIRNIRKITRTMELIATARFKKAMDRAAASTAYTKRITALVADLANAGASVSHPLLEPRSEVKNAVLLVLTGNRGLCGGYNSNVQRTAFARLQELKASIPHVSVEVSGKRGIAGMKFRGVTPDATYLHFEDKPRFEEVEVLATKYLNDYLTGKIDRLDVAYTKFENIARQQAVVETLLPLAAIDGLETPGEKTEAAEGAKTAKAEVQYEFLPSAESILEEVVPTSFKVKLFKCFLDAAVSEQIARMTAMKAATDNANKIIKKLSMTYNRARQSQITGEIMEVLGGVEALKNK
ncbi:MAG: ATP synthase F1 subunit gamma [Planctomycetales bacterium]|nr:ATP synthase F1 subunit gamma [Planctomycetales bacterium]MBN8627467.1 ATP synthase F1 subunit gamma [Planctomycetota bacterium]